MTDRTPESYPAAEDMRKRIAELEASLASAMGKQNAADAQMAALTQQRDALAVKVTKKGNNILGSNLDSDAEPGRLPFQTSWPQKTQNITRSFASAHFGGFAQNMQRGEMLHSQTTGSGSSGFQLLPVSPFICKRA